ncbi:hypothetical protein CTEN210_17879 [Chaetoceros tenuissimus]|uniref:Uncharacterized protein n=1 Tax=Chaetoceros tenuissimus TaxID=426638 RepID=A0AAD3DBM6_9STRA|nr:hypothetical protein CTEN210_17879 [Chaetoceros tenuissimus]
MDSYEDGEALRPLPSVLENFDCGYPSENGQEPPTLQDAKHNALYQFINEHPLDTEHHDIVDDCAYYHESKNEEGIEKFTINNLDAPRDAYQPSYDGASSVVSSKKRDFGTHSVASQEYSNYESSYYEIPPSRSSRKAYSSVSHDAKRRSITGYTEIEKIPDHETSDPYSFYNVPNMRQRREAREKNKVSNSDENMSSAYLRFKTLNQIQPSKRNNHDIKPEFNSSVDTTLPSSTSSCFNHNQKNGLNQAIYGQESNFMSANINNAAKADSCYSLPADYGSHKWRSIYMQHDLHFEPAESLDNIEPLPIHSSGSNIDPIEESLDNIEPLPIHSSGSNIDPIEESLDNIEPLPLHSLGSNMEQRHHANVDNADSEDFSAYNDRSDSISPSSDYQQLDNFDCDQLFQKNQPPLHTRAVTASHVDTLSEFGRDFDRLVTVEDPNELHQMYNNAKNNETDFPDPMQSMDKMSSNDVTVKKQKVKTDKKTINHPSKKILSAASMKNYKDKVDDPSSPKMSSNDVTVKEQNKVKTNKKTINQPSKKILSATSIKNYKDKKVDVDDPSSPIVSLSELQESEFGTSFSQLVLSNYCKTILRSKEVKGMRKTLKEGFAGLQCINCTNCYKLAKGGRFFPSQIKTISDSRKGLLSFSGHLYKCHGVSKELKQKLKVLQETHEDERRKMKYGSQKAFFSLIWMRLHGDMNDKS